MNGTLASEFNVSGLDLKKSEKINARNTKIITMKIESKMIAFNLNPKPAILGCCGVE